MYRKRFDHRLHGVLLVAHGMTCPEVAALLGDAPKTVEYWVRGFEEKGLAALREGERSGRPRRLREKHLREINAALRRMPRELGLGGNLWVGKTLAAWIEREYRIELGVRQCQRLFRQWGFRLRKRIRNDRRRIKKLQGLMEDDAVDLRATDEVHFQQHGPRCRMWVPPENQGPGIAPSTDTAQRGIFWSRKTARWKVPAFSGDG